MKIKDILLLAGSVVVCLLAGFIGSLFNVRSIPGWYETIEKPFFNPPNWVFGPVWTVLYILMGIALYLILVHWKERKKHKQVRNATVAFGIQLLLNAAWSALFFGLQSPMLAFIEILLLLAAIVYTTYLFFSISRPAAYLMMPYILWVTFASVLNLSIWILNM
ncbi:tryptophan-rich sensory protein [Candidatus Woesearchaeota archaeon]|nr:tryptophan-rich sensory protein [Candidatus Woesearchaeota archaeon]